MISVANLMKEYGSQELFRGVSFCVNAKERVGLVGRNGHGKTTLLRIITGQETTDEGNVIIPKGYTLGYLDQHINFTQKTVLKEACFGLKEDEKDQDWKVKKILSGLGFDEEDFEKDPQIFPGGYQMRINLTKVLVSHPHMLLLDEPTNFLDIVSIRWLIRFLCAWQGEVILISHDRGFMDSVVTHVVGIHRAKVKKMQGTTSKYYEQLALEEEVYEKTRQKEEQEKKHLTQFINRFRAKATKASLVQSRIKKLDKMQGKDKLNEIESLDFSFDYEPLQAKVLMEVQNLCFTYDVNAPYIVDHINLTIEQYDKIGIIGKNGKGKSTLLKLLSEKLAPIEGTIKQHPKVEKGYFEQANTVDLDKEKTIEEELLYSHSSATTQKVRNICGLMMFSGGTVMKKIGVLSGGEKSRVLLAKLLLTPSNLLLLDEPTHHLDVYSTDSIIEAVQEFSGASIVVTHDEHFLHQAVNKLIVFQGGKISIFLGTYQEFLDKVGWIEDEEGSASKKQTSDQSKQSRKEEKQKRAEFVKLRSKTLKPLEEKIHLLETTIVESEEKLSQMTQKMVEASHNQDKDKIVELNKLMQELKNKVDDSYQELEEVHDEYERQKQVFSEEE